MDQPRHLRDTGAMRRQTDHPLEVYVYTGAIIVAGIVAFLWTAQSFPIAETISLTATGGSEGVFLGLAFWTLLGLAGGMRVERLHGHGVEQHAGVVDPDLDQCGASEVPVAVGTFDVDADDLGGDIAQRRLHLRRIVHEGHGRSDTLCGSRDGG